MTELLYSVQIHGSFATEKMNRSQQQHGKPQHYTHTGFKICYERKMQFKIHGIPLLGLKKNLEFQPIHDKYNACPGQGFVCSFNNLVVMTDHLPGPLPVSQMKKKCYLPRRKSTCPRCPDDTFFELSLQTHLRPYAFQSMFEDSMMMMMTMITQIM